MNTADIAEAPPLERSRKAARLKQARSLHLYLGVFFAPAILFFAFTGALQVFGLHESHPGDTYQAPKWIQKLASIHKKQTLQERRGPGPGAVRRPGADANSGEVRGRIPGGPERSPQVQPRQSASVALLKWFSASMSAGLIATTLLGIFMAFQYNRNAGLIWGLLGAGTLLPALLIFATAS